MPSNYPGNPAATQAPGPTPALGVMPIGALPIDSDVPNASSINQAFKECLDWIAFLSQWGSTTPLVTWVDTVSYAAGRIVVDPHDGNTYRVLPGHTSTIGNHPYQDDTNWIRWGHTDDEVRDLAPVSTSVSAVGVTASAGTFGTVIQTLSGTLREVIGTITVPVSGGVGTTLITLSGAATFAIDARLATKSDTYAPSTCIVSCNGSNGTNTATIAVAAAGGATTLLVSFRLSGR